MKLLLSDDLSNPLNLKSDLEWRFPLSINFYKDESDTLSLGSIYERKDGYISKSVNVSGLSELWLNVSIDIFQDTISKVFAIGHKDGVKTELEFTTTDYNENNRLLKRTNIDFDTISIAIFCDIKSYSLFGK